MGQIVRIQSPAKVNLHLDVLGRREDGYHELLSLFQMISWYDELTIRSLKVDDVCEIHGNLPVAVERTTIYRAVEAFRRVTGIRNGVSVTIEKRIPMGAGLGGGSSNAAFTLTALNTLFSPGLPDEQLLAVASKIGSDVPFFCGSPAAVVSGRGETIRPVLPRNDFRVLLVYPDLAISTADAFAWLDRWRANRRETDHPSEPAGTADEAELRTCYEERPLREWTFGNSFYGMLCERYPVLRKIREMMLDAGAESAAVSGSGSTMFGLFSGSGPAERAAGQLRSVFPTVMVSEPLARRPFAILE